MIQVPFSMITSSLILTNILLLTFHPYHTKCFVSQIHQNINRKNAKNQFSTRRQPTHRSMFTGIVEEMGSVISLEENIEMEMWDNSIGIGTELTIHGDIAMQDSYLGCSISVNGVCLTATKLDDETNQFKVGLAPETLRLTNLGDLQTGNDVNLERAAGVSTRNSGHFVQGHVDNIGTIIEKWRDGNSMFHKIQVPKSLISYIVPKGFIAIDGTSLTVCDVGDDWFTFMLVEYTQKKIVITKKDVGGKVNIEVDVLGKYAKSVVGSLEERIQKLEEKVRLLSEK